ncbi:MAG: hypothetical protein IJU00_10505 [Selenomonas sp.]|nr:hypothetical protein [Selenomonas sp.]
MSDEQISGIYNKMVADMKEVVDYAGVLYREIAIDRQRNNGRSVRVMSWADAERQRAERNEQEQAENNINQNNENHPNEQDGFLNGRNRDSRTVPNPNSAESLTNTTR